MKEKHRLQRYADGTWRKRGRKDPDRIDGAGDGTRTREYKLGKLVPYHLATPAILTLACCYAPCPPRLRPPWCSPWYKSLPEPFRTSAVASKPPPQLGITRTFGSVDDYSRIFLLAGMQSICI